MFSSRTNFNKLFLFHIIKLIKKAVTLRNSLCYSFYFFCTTLVKFKFNGIYGKDNQILNSNTTLVKVKFIKRNFKFTLLFDSNTTLVKVKWGCKKFEGGNKKNSNTTLVKVKCQNGVSRDSYIKIQIQHLLKLN